MFSSLLTKARNLHVTLHLRSGRRLACKIIDFDDVFCEVLVRVNRQTGEFASALADLDAQDAAQWLDDRILISIADISIVA